MRWCRECEKSRTSCGKLLSKARVESELYGLLYGHQQHRSPARTREAAMFSYRLATRAKNGGKEALSWSLWFAKACVRRVFGSGVTLS